MSDNGWDPWKLVTLGLGLVMTTLLIGGLVMAQRNSLEAERKFNASLVSAPPPPPPLPPEGVATAPAPVVAPTPPPPPPRTARVPSHSVVAACNRYAQRHAGQRDKTAEVVKDSVVGAVVGGAVGAAGGAIADGGRGAGTGAAIGGLVGAGGGALYGVNENRKHDAHYRSAYAACLRARGYKG